MPPALRRKRVESKFERTIEAHPERLLEASERHVARLSLPAETLADSNEFHERMDQALAELESDYPREADILRRRYGIGRPEQTLREVAKDVDLTQERVRQIERKAIGILRHPARARKLEGLLDG